MKNRLDIILVERGYYETRNKAKAAIENGDILVNDKIITKSGHLVEDIATIKILKESNPYVSRGGLKLSKALQSFCVDVNDKICLDIGASTGGFTDCLLRNGATKVYALDVGSNQLVETLKNDNRVVSIENTNFRNIDVKEYKKLNLDIICADVSFISLTYLLENVSQILEKDGIFIALIKPQFEVMKKEHNKNGVVNDKKIHLRVIRNIIENAYSYDLYLNKLDYSPIKGEKAGNIEYLGLFSFNNKNIDLDNINHVIENAYKDLK